MPHPTRHPPQPARWALALCAALAAAGAQAALDPAREAAPADGWAGTAGGTSGGSAATSEHIYSVANRGELLAALARAGAQPKIIRVTGRIDMSDGVPYTSAADQGARSRLKLSSNTTLIGAGPAAQLVNGGIDIIAVRNVIVRNLSLVAPCDIAPVWDPSDGSTGSWNAAYDAITVQGADHVWIDRNTITDAPTTDDTLPIENGKTRQCHDGAIDITRGANHVSITYNLFDRHDKALLIGHSDSFSADSGKLKVTIANNVFTSIVQRAPRVRYGQVHVYNNYHVNSTGAASYRHAYSLGVGTAGQVISQANVFAITGAGGCASVVQTLNATASSSFVDTGSVLNGAALAGCPATSGSSWTIPYAYTLRPAALVKANALAKAGAGRIASTLTGTAVIGATPGSLRPADGATGVHTDTLLQLAFDAAPRLTGSGTVTVRRSSDNALVDSIDLSSAPSAGDTQTAISRHNLEIDALGLGAMPDSSARARFVWYRPVSISANLAQIRLHNHRLDWATQYTVTVSADALAGTVNAAPFAGASWRFTTRARPAGYTSITVDDDGGSADFQTLQGALNWVMSHCASAAAASHGCNSAATAKTITLKNGHYPELAVLRNVANLRIVGESRGGVRVGASNFESLNAGSGSTATSAGTALGSSGRVPGHRVLGGGRAVLLVENADLLTLQGFTLENPHGRLGVYDNQAEALYFNTGTTAAAARLVAREMDFLSEQDTLQLKGYAWIYQSLVSGNVDFIWGNVMAALFEDCEIRSVFDPASSSPGYIVQARATAGDAGFVFLNSRLTAGPGVTQAYLARSGGTTSSSYVDNVAYLNTRMDSHILPIGWCVGTGSSKTGTGRGSCSSNPPPWAGTATGASTDSAGWRELGSTDLAGLPLDLGARLGLATVTVAGSASSVQLARPLGSTTGLGTRAEVFARSTAATGAPGGWVPVP
ncbi:pectinesterase family protein [Aquabacterium sp. OR-4]|uniref:pectinesterase family protein n=1 Tax=Aquabacterium sp. OR-4 TaxID=2978127 RepID=UPI0021B4BE71|nr:pectinesterase family protein [Aquabacterium sp. OR-4]MDT7837087.1 pectinesterase family protein [Aquabacterium sp. OR-4]